MARAGCGVSGYVSAEALGEAGAAIPLSLLRLRPLFNTPRLGELANDINRLLLLRLLREPALYVLEREKLMHAREEAFLAGQDADSFWAGSYVVDGRVSYDLVQTNRVTCAVSIRPPATGTTTASAPELTEEGRADDLPELVERITTKVCEALGAPRQVAAWDKEQEAARLTALAGGLREPKQQADALATAMALGRRDTKTAGAYRSALRAVAFRDARRFSGLRLDLAPGEALQAQAQAFVELLRFDNSYRAPGGDKARCLVPSPRWRIPRCFSSARSRRDARTNWMKCGRTSRRNAGPLPPACAGGLPIPSGTGSGKLRCERLPTSTPPHARS